MELREIISFYHVARLRSVSKAARKLELGQPTVTTHLRKLEGEFGITLFDRIKRPIQLTSEGSLFYELVTPIVESIDTLKTQMDYSEGRGSFVVGAYPDIVSYHLPRPIRQFRSRYPDVRMRLVARSYANLIQLVKSGEVDLALCSAPPTDDPSLEFSGLFDYNVVLITEPSHDLLHRDPVTIEDMAAFPLILNSPESLSRRRVEQKLRERSVNYDVVLEMDNTEMIKRYVAIGMGIAIVSDFTPAPGGPRPARCGASRSHLPIGQHRRLHVAGQVPRTRSAQLHQHAHRESLRISRRPVGLGRRPRRRASHRGHCQRDSVTLAAQPDWRCAAIGA